MFKVIKAKYEKGVLKPLEPLDLREGEEVRIVIQPGESIAEKFYGVAKKHRPNLKSEEFLGVLEEVEDEDFRGY